MTVEVSCSGKARRVSRRRSERRRREGVGTERSFVWSLWRVWRCCFGGVGGELLKERRRGRRRVVVATRRARVIGLVGGVGGVVEGEDIFG